MADNLNLESIFWNGLRFIRGLQILCVLMDLKFPKRRQGTKKIEVYLCIRDIFLYLEHNYVYANFIGCSEIKIFNFVWQCESFWDNYKCIFISTYLKISTLPIYIYLTKNMPVVFIPYGHYDICNTPFNRSNYFFF